MIRRTGALSRILLISFVMLLGMAAISSAAIINWSNGALPVDGNWNNTANWTGGIKPNATSDSAKVLMATGPVFSTGRAATAYKVYLDGTNGSITMDGGTLNTNNFFGIGYTAANSGTLTVNSGTITIAAGILNNLFCGAAGSGTLNMSGGAINLPGSTFFVARDLGSTGTVNLSGGTITCGTLSVRQNSATANGTINITGDGKLIFTSSALPVATYIANGWIKAYNGLGIVVIDTTTMPGKTILSAMITEKAQVPRPSNGTIDMIHNATTLGWTPGMSTVSHDVYLGTSLADVNNAQRFAGDIDGSGIVDFKDVAKLSEYWLLDPADTEPYVGVNADSTVDFFDYTLLAQDWKNPATIFKANQDANSFDPGTLAFGTTYYWRIDEVNGPDTFKGDVWSFTTHSGKASDVTPMDGDLNVRSKAVLAWTAAPNAVSHDVYFGTANPPPFVGNQTALYYNPGGMDNSTTYYWRINEKYATATVEGELWSFRTMPAESEPAFVFVHASDPQMGWSSCGGTNDYLWGTTVDKINQINPDFVLVTGDLVDSSTSAPQVATYKSYKSALTPTIGVYEVPGNHDLGEPPNQAKYDAWATNYGYGTAPGAVPWYKFEYGNNLFIGLDTVVLVSTTDMPGKDVEELNWLANTLADANTRGYDHIFVFQHYGYTADKWVGGSPNKTTLYNLLNQYHVTALFAGHTHYDAYSNVNGMDDVTERSCTCNLGGTPPPPGVGIIKVYADRIERESRSLDSLPMGTANIRKGPYLTYPGNNTQMTVLWQVDAGTSSCNIAWGTDTTYSMGTAYTTEYGTDHQHRHTITGLTPGTKYYYRVKVSGTPYTGSFTAAPASDATNVKFFMYGDTRTNTSSNAALCGRMISDYGSDLAYQTMVLHAGDWVETDIETTWTSQWFTLGSNPNLWTATANMPFMGCLGNHERNGDTTSAAYRKYWPFPYPTSRFYYSYDYGPVHITMLDQWDGGDELMSAAQLAWLESDLAASAKPWKIIVLHAPGWSCGGGHINNPQVQNVIQPLCVTNGVQLVLGGHNHYYSRAVVSGVQHVTSGGGGASLYDITAGSENIVTSSKSLDYCKVAISGDTLTCNVYSSTGTVLDTFTVTK